MLTPDSDFRLVLKRELESRSQRDPRYSLRRFAGDLGLSPARVSEILSGKQGLSRPAARKIATTLGYNVKERDLFCDLVEAQHARAQLTRELAKLRIEKLKTASSFHTVQMDAFQVVSDWYHIALFQLITLKGFRNDASWISKALGITLAEASSAIDRLKRLNVIREVDGTLEPVEEYISTPDDVPSSAIRKFHRQILEKAIQALETQPVEDRDVTTMVLSIDKGMLPEAKRWIKSFRRRFCRKMSESKKKTDVYALSIQLHSLTAADFSRPERKTV